MQNIKPIDYSIGAKEARLVYWGAEKKANTNLGNLTSLLPFFTPCSPGICQLNLSSVLHRRSQSNLPRNKRDSCDELLRSLLEREHAFIRLRIYNCHVLHYSGSAELSDLELGVADVRRHDMSSRELDVNKYDLRMHWQQELVQAPRRIRRR